MDFTQEIYSTNYHNISEIDNIFTRDVITSLDVVNKKKQSFYNIPCSFDIETTSFMKDGVKYANMYAFMFNINGVTFFGRTWEEWEQFINSLYKLFELGEKNKLIVYVQNLPYEFQFIMKRFQWDTVFATNERKVLKCESNGLVFKDSLILSGLSLAKMGDNLERYKIQKMVGDLDYRLYRHHLTPLTQKEIMYCINDVRVLSAYIQEKIENDGDITKIPMTNTGYVRNHYRDAMIGQQRTRTKGQKDNIKKVQKKLHINNSDEYEQLKRAFQGGFTHANAHYYGKELNNVSSYDFASSYPSVILTEQFPMSRGRRIELESIDDFNSFISTHCCVFDIRLKNVYSKITQDNILSTSKCWNVVGCLENNGRINYCDSLETTVTEIDFAMINEFYGYDSLEVSNFTVYEKGYLPREMVETCLKLFEDKTKLKGVEDKYQEFMKSKGMLNSTYGMMVTDFARDEIELSSDYEWNSVACNIDESIDIYNNSRNRFLFYVWGVYVTSYARRNLFTGILELGDDYVYSDTDSVKCLNHENHKEYFESYNQKCYDKIVEVSKIYNIPLDKFLPTNIKGKQAIIGIWDYEGTYETFKTLGAKRYAYTDSKGFHITVSGLGKSNGASYLVEKARQENTTPMRLFNDHLSVPKGKTGKLTHTYIDDEFTTTLCDYKGSVASVHELSYIHLDECEFSMSVSDKYLQFISDISDVH